jgi:hypothetical protein
MMLTSSMREPLSPAVNTVPTFVGAVRDVSAVAMLTAEALTVAAKLGAAAIFYFSFSVSLTVRCR